MEEEANTYQNAGSSGIFIFHTPMPLLICSCRKWQQFQYSQLPPPMHLGKGVPSTLYLGPDYSVPLGTVLWLVLLHVIAETKGKEGLGLTAQLTQDERLPLKVFLSNQSLRKTLSWLNTNSLGELALACSLCP